MSWFQWSLLRPLAKGMVLVALGLGAGMTACRPPVEPGPARDGQAISASATGTLELWANGEAFLREGLVSKEGWALQFEHVYVTLADITAYQTDPPFDPQGEGELQAKALVSLTGPLTVDLVPERALLGSLEAPPWALQRPGLAPSAGSGGASKGLLPLDRGQSSTGRRGGRGDPLCAQVQPRAGFCLRRVRGGDAQGLCPGRPGGGSGGDFPLRPPVWEWQPASQGRPQLSGAGVCLPCEVGPS